jgi:hypothetical protein
MFRFLRFRAARAKRAEDEADVAAFVERRTVQRLPVFHDAVLTIEGYFKIRAAITDLSPRGACVAYSVRVDLPSRIVIAAPALAMERWARVAWQGDGVAGLEFVDEG